MALQTWLTTSAHAMSDTADQLSGPTLSNCHAATAEKSRNTEAIRPKPNQNPYQVQLDPLMLKWTHFIATNTASAAGPRFFCDSIPPAVWPAQKRTSKAEAIR